MNQNGTNIDPDLTNYKGIYYTDQNQKYQDEKTGAHFDFRDMCHRLTQVLVQQLEKTDASEVTQIAYPAKIEPKELPDSDSFLLPKDHTKVTKNGSKKLTVKPTIKLPKSRAVPLGIEKAYQNATFAFAIQRKSPNILAKNSRNQDRSTICQTEATLSAAKKVPARKSGESCAIRKVKQATVKMRPRSQIGVLKGNCDKVVAA